MTRLLPKTLFGQTLLILLAGLAISQLAGAWIYSGARQEAVRAVGGLAAAQRIANLVRLIEEAPVEWRERIVGGSSDPGFRVAIMAREPQIVTADGAQLAPDTVIEAYLRDELPTTASRMVRVRVAASAALPFGPAHGPGMGAGIGPGMGPGWRRGPAMHGMDAWRGLEAAIRLSDGRWLAVNTLLPDTGPTIGHQLILAIIVMAGIVGLVATLAVRRLTAPLGALAGAADRLGRDVGAPPLAETGTLEMRQAAQAFNAMQARLRRLIESRTLMLAAISHDLRTELQLLRLRAENSEPPDERQRMLATIAEMEAMLSATLAFARDEASAEPRRSTDIRALLASVVDDMSDAGLPVTLAAPGEPAVAGCQPTALRRALTNLIDNAIKYGRRADVTMRQSPAAIEIIIEDEGPGIPEGELGRVVEPFYRIEASRSRDTGGIGLGLAIASSIAEAQGGELMLGNRPQGGLKATIVLPR